jgi:hypothetical protein
MTTNLAALLDRVKTWPAARQAEAETLLEALETQTTASVGLSDEQAAEVERRLAAPAAEGLTLAEARTRLASRRA